MNESTRSNPNEAEGVAALLNHGVESLALLIELVAVLKTKGVLTEEEVGAMGKRAEDRRVEILNGQIPS